MTIFKRHPKPKRSDVEKALAERWHAEAARRSCVLCGAPGPCDGHHLIPKQAIRSKLRERRRAMPEIDDLYWEQRFAAIMFDRRNMMALCRTCHANVEARSRRIPRSLLGAGVFELARELGLESRIERHYSA